MPNESRCDSVSKINSRKALVVVELAKKKVTMIP